MIPGYGRNQQHRCYSRGEGTVLLSSSSRPVNNNRHDHGDRQVRQERAPSCHRQTGPQRFDHFPRDRVEQFVPLARDRDVVAEDPEVFIPGQNDGEVVVKRVWTQERTVTKVRTRNESVANINGRNRPRSQVVDREESWE